MNASLEEQIAERRALAEKRDFYHKTWVVATHLGKLTDACQSVYVFRADDFVVEHWSNVGYGPGDMPGTSGKISYAGRVVFEASHDTVVAYVPGAWERLFTEIVHRAYEAQHARQHPVTSPEATAANARNKWGL